MEYAPKRKRPRSCKGWTRRFELGDDPDTDPNLYVILNTDDKDELFEVFIKRGKSGTGENVYCEALARVISLSLRCGINPEDISRQLRGLTGQHPIWEAPIIERQKATLLLSVPHCVSLAIDEWILGKVEEIESG